MNVKKIFLISLIAVAVIASASVVSAGLFSGDDNSTNSQDDSIPMETQEIDGLFKISVPVGAKFVYDYETRYGPTYTNKGEYDVVVSDIIFIPQNFNSRFPGQNVLYEEDGNITVYQDLGMRDLYYVDMHIDGYTVCLMGYGNLELLKKMVNSIEIIN
ncbi:MAG: hypothetical protein IJF83_13740 [Methanobrevibacter sp.]|nr:hypothetical protein [Methanobrevibacter sp.]